MGIISELPVVNFKEHAVDIIEYGQIVSLESLTSYTVYSFTHDQLHDDSEMGTLVGLTAPDKAMRTYRKLHDSKKPEVLDRNMCGAARYLADTVVASLGNMMEQLNVVLFGFHQ